MTCPAPGTAATKGSAGAHSSGAGICGGIQEQGQESTSESKALYWGHPATPCEAELITVNMPSRASVSPQGPSSLSILRNERAKGEAASLHTPHITHHTHTSTYILYTPHTHPTPFTAHTHTIHNTYTHTPYIIHTHIHTIHNTYTHTHTIHNTHTYHI